MMKRFLSLFLVIGLIVALAVPVSADDSSSSSWIELLEITSVRADGSNWFNTQGKTTSLSISIPVEIRMCKIDMLLTNLSSDPFTSAKFVSGSSSQSLTIVQVNNVTTRIYGNIPTGYYGNIEIVLTKNGTGVATNQLLSCRVTSLNVIDNPAHGTLRRAFSDPNPINLPGDFTVAGDGSYDSYAYKLIPVIITDWQKYDYITLFGSITRMALNSFRASIGSKGLPYEITYMESVPTGTEGESWYNYEYNSHTEITYLDPYDPSIHDETAFESGTGSGEGMNTSTVTYGGAVLFTITIDLTGIDRTTSGTLDCYFTCIANPGLGYAFNVQNVTGSVLVADNTDVSWWTRFTMFMQDLFGSKDDSGALDDLGSSSDSISQNTSQIHNFEQSQQAVLDNNFAQIQGAITFTNFAAALVFVQKYTNMTFNGISQYAIIFTLPLFLGLFFYLCSRIPGITRWKTPPPRSPSPRSKGGGKT